MSSLLLVLLLLLCCGSIKRSAAAKNCSSVWCGKHNIRPPFRLQNITPQHCGDHTYTLACEDHHNQLFLYWKSVKLSVQSINYNNYTIRLADANFVLQHNIHQHRLYYSKNSCLLFNYSLAPYNFSDSEDEPYHYWLRKSNGGRFMLIKQMIYVRCMNDSLYVNVNGKSLWELGLRDSCYVEWMYPTSWPHVDESQVKNTSCRDIQNMMIYGFELSWAPQPCSAFLAAPFVEKSCRIRLHCRLKSLRPPSPRRLEVALKLPPTPCLAGRCPAARIRGVVSRSVVSSPSPECSRWLCFPSLPFPSLSRPNELKREATAESNIKSEFLCLCERKSERGRE
ncbi:hypothetical protein PIB30_100611 [Stylosanthes scabra]|uniref:Wall-associated receptor kinase galacturonan-binding domain-containing protein n=1 Tax=Stylosanthes scabra TaxID=79078 RepID=A0ABU6UZM5_9FABA|nr:hypothetical protein [Stylosanthes scabra]